MITHEEAMAILNKNGNKYTEEEVKMIVELLIKIAHLELELIKSNQ
jgi:hypothetical protein